MNKEQNEVRSVAVAILADRLNIPIKEAKLMLADYLRQTTEDIGRSWTVEEWEEIAGNAVAEILSDNDPDGQDLEC